MKLSKNTTQVVKDQLRQLTKEAMEVNDEEGDSAVETYERGWAWGKATGYEYALRDLMGKDAFYALIAEMDAEDQS